MMQTDDMGMTPETEWLERWGWHLFVSTCITSGATVVCLAVLAWRWAA